MDSFSNNYGPPSRPGRNPLFPFDPSAPDSDMYIPPSKSARRIMLAQQARDRHLRQARVLLILIGVLTMVGNVLLFATARQQALAATFSGDEVEAAIAVARVVYGCSILIGVVFVALGMLVRAYPFRTTVLGLVLCIGGNLLGFVLNPVNLSAAVIIKLLLVIGLIKAVHAAVASERERALEAEYASGARQ